MGLTSDRNDPRLGYGSNDQPVQQNEAYLILSEQERAQGFIRPLRLTYRHDECGRTTSMAAQIAETYAANPKFYGATYCCYCMKHRPVSEFKWLDGSVVGS